MKTAFGEIRVVDAHAHFFSHKLFTTLAGGEENLAVLREKLPFEFPPEDPTGLAARWVEELDRNEIARTVLIASVPGDEESVAAAARASRRNRSITAWPSAG